MLTHHNLSNVILITTFSKTQLHPRTCKHVVVVVVVVLIRSLCTEIPMSETLATDKSPQETDHADGQIFLL